jgi:cation diffusion facilitator family transporter
MVLKAAAYFLTDSVGLFSDALESGVNLAGGLMAVAMLTIAARPADTDHPYGHSKAEYFSSAVEGSLILVAAFSIAVAAVRRLIVPRPLEQLGLGLGISVAASLVNLAVALILLRAGRRHDSITLEANAQHLLTDVWTSAGVLIGIGAVAVTGWIKLDPIVALLVSGNIVWTGRRIIRDSVGGLMDKAISAEEQEKVRCILEAHLKDGAQYHALRTRQAGAQRFISFHVLVPGTWTVARGHQLLEHIETDLCRALPQATVFSHLEPLNDPASWDDSELGRWKSGSAV